MMTIIMFGFGVALVVMSVGIGVAVSKDVLELIDFAYDPNDSTNGPRKADVPLEHD